MMRYSSLENHNAVVTNSTFLSALSVAAPRGSVLWACGFIGNPYNSEEANWSGLPYNPAMHAAQVDAWQRYNTYFSVACFTRAPDGTLSRRKSHFARLLALVADDVDPEDLLGTPSWGFLTSPGKRQIGILLDTQDPDCADVGLVSRLMQAMVVKELISLDKSGNSAVRYGRMPVGVNGKPRDGGVFSVQVEYWNPAIRLTLEDAASIFGIDLDEVRREAAAAPEGVVTTAVEQGDRLRTHTTSILRGDNLHESINLVAASMVASGAKGGAIVNMIRALMDCSAAPRDERWQARYDDIPRSVSTAEEKFRLASTAGSVDLQTGEILVDKRPLFTPVHELLGAIKSIQWLIEHYLEMDALSMVFGPSGAGKSFQVVDWACCIATGTSWHGMPVRQGAVFYIAGEGHNGLARRFAAWSKARGVPITKDTPLFKSNRAISMLDPQAGDQLLAEVNLLAEQTGQLPVLVVIDTLARNFGAGDENKQADANLFVAAADRIRREYGANVMTVHHSGHDMDRARGSSVFKAAMDQEFWVKGSNGVIELKATKMKDAELPTEKRFKISSIGLGVEDEAGVEIQGAYLEQDGDPLEFRIGARKNGKEITAGEFIKAMYPKWPGNPGLCEALGISDRSVSKLIKVMVQAGLIVSRGAKQAGYELTEKAIGLKSKRGLEILHKDDLQREAVEMGDEE